MKTRVLIVDDEASARRRLSSLLGLEADFEVVGQCADGRAAVKAIAALAPDLLFLDVQMPGMNGFEVLAAVGTAHAPAVIFVSANDRFAVRAFEAQALDYLLKPLRRERFQAALQRVRRGLPARAPQLVARLTSATDRAVVRSGNRLLFVAFDELEYIRASANYVRLHMGREICQVRETISTMESRLPRDRFVRIHRSYIVNLAAVRELYHAGGGEYLISLRSGRELPVGPSYPPAIREALDSARMARFGSIGGI